MGWKNWPSWLKGGVIFGILLVFIIVGLFFYGRQCAQSYNQQNSNRDFPYICAGISVPFLIPHVFWDLIHRNLPLLGHLTNPLWSISFIFLSLISIFLWFLIGVIVGMFITWIIVKIKPWIKRLAPWLKGGLIASLFYFLFLIPNFKFTESATSLWFDLLIGTEKILENPYEWWVTWAFIFTDFLTLLTFFIIGSIIGFIIGKIKSKSKKK